VSASKRRLTSQASFAADFSVTRFNHLRKLPLWHGPHGRNSYRRLAKLAQFPIHLGLIISVMQAVFSVFYFVFVPIALYQGWLMVDPGYVTIYTMSQFSVGTFT